MKRPTCKTCGHFVRQHRPECDAFTYDRVGGRSGPCGCNAETQNRVAAFWVSLKPKEVRDG